MTIKAGRTDYSAWRISIAWNTRQQQWWWSAWKLSTRTELWGFVEFKEQAFHEMTAAIRLHEETSASLRPITRTKPSPTPSTPSYCRFTPSSQHTQTTERADAPAARCPNPAATSTPPSTHLTSSFEFTAQTIEPAHDHDDRNPPRTISLPRLAPTAATGSPGAAWPYRIPESGRGSVVCAARPIDDGRLPRSGWRTCGKRSLSSQP